MYIFGGMGNQCPGRNLSLTVSRCFKSFSHVSQFGPSYFKKQIRFRGSVCSDVWRYEIPWAAQAPLVQPGLDDLKAERNRCFAKGLLSQVSDWRLGAVLRQAMRGTGWTILGVGQCTSLDDAKVRGNVWDRLKASCGSGAARNMA